MHVSQKDILREALSKGFQSPPRCLKVNFLNQPAHFENSGKVKALKSDHSGVTSNTRSYFRSLQHKLGVLWSRSRTQEGTFLSVNACRASQMLDSVKLFKDSF